MADLRQLMDNEVLMAFTSYATIILTKMMFMSSATAFQRITNKVFANPEDCAGFGKGENAKKFVRTDEKVERVRRLSSSFFPHQFKTCCYFHNQMSGPDCGYP
uniref:Microsomal glutathione S-transferase 1 n=1 Tax=Mus spicilegus TaxID=10103 RepID=A0A8C6HXS6_MUSSI